MARTSYLHFILTEPLSARTAALLRLTLFVSSAGWGLLTGLVAFFLTSTHLSPLAGGYAPTLALLCYAIPMYTLRLCHNLIGDAVDALFVCAHLDAENQLSHCPKAVEAVSLPLPFLLSGGWSLLTTLSLSLCAHTTVWHARGRRRRPPLASDLSSPALSFPSSRTRQCCLEIAFSVSSPCRITYAS